MQSSCAILKDSVVTDWSLDVEGAHLVTVFQQIPISATQNR